jgi:hypothetical protein
MQADGAVRGGGKKPRRGGRRLEVLLTVAAILVIVAVMVLMTRGMVAPGTGGVGAQDAKAGVGSAIVHDDAGNMPPELSYPLPHGKVANPNAGPAIIHDDPWNMPSNTRPEPEAGDRR